MMLFGSSWDIEKALSPVSKAITRLARTRLGVLKELIDWLVELDVDARVAVLTLWAIEVWEEQGHAGFEKEASAEQPF